MSDKRARYVGGSMTGVDVVVRMKDGDEFTVHVDRHELPASLPDGRKIPVSFRDSLLEQSDNWSEVNRATGDETKGKTAAADKESDR